MEIRHLLWLLLRLVSPKEALSSLVFRTHEGLTAVPNDISNDATSIYLNSNNITAIRQIDFNDKYLDLIDLFLRWNRITAIDNGCFKGTIIRVLAINCNDLTVIPDLHEVSSTLAILDLTSNEIAAISVAALDYLTELTELYLSQNPFSTVPDINQALSALTVFYLENTPLNCCCENIWLKQTRNSLSLHMSHSPCVQPPEWTAIALNDITEDMIRRQPCQVSAALSRLCVPTKHKLK
ncbi:hypothetical protein CAPTEDRAFT_191296 [Capitella teleta]|uniref:LRRCT domain-containing protein n=1 Tax=Capitella teleta TaxID=283909 RepID=R7UF21_CAPTE|nr:hypothetical protein CAPTEDRAFT_191296 [Capitella teleta]|eukprot:ELU01872.1 hypothetical protein CAPTEDRAFT_191296 [Capitella teleta]